MSPIASKEDDEEKPWGFTCVECPIVPPRGGEPDYVTVERVIDHADGTWTREPRSKALHVPTRCTACDTRKKRWTRMRRRVKAVYDAAESLPGRKYRRPKFLTFGLPSGTSPRYEDRWELKRILNSRLPRARERLEATLGVKGGVYVIEITSRLVPLATELRYPDDPEHGRCCGLRWREGRPPLMTWKHHAHVHMVVVCPYIEPEEFEEKCASLLSMGLGRINLRSLSSKTHSKEEARKAVARFVSKYLNKDGGRLRSWGILRNRRS